MEQLVARRAHNPKVAGSSPAPATTISKRMATTICFFVFRKDKYVSLAGRTIFLARNYGVPALILYFGKYCHIRIIVVLLKKMKKANSVKAEDAKLWA
jgi:hypothetical protein